MPQTTSLHHQTYPTIYHDPPPSAGKYRISIASNWLSGQEVLSWLYLGLFPLRLATHFPQTRPIYLSPSSSVFSHFRSITSPAVLANLCGEWGTPAGRRNTYGGGDKVPIRLQSPTETSVPAASWASQFTHRVQPSPPLCPAYHPEPEGMLGCADNGVAQRKKSPRMGPELVGTTQRQEKGGGRDLDQSQDKWTQWVPVLAALCPTAPAPSPCRMTTSWCFPCFRTWRTMSPFS